MSSRPAGRLAVLQKPARALGAVGLYPFSAPAGGIDFRDHTSYWVVIDVSTGTNQSIVHTLQGNNEDHGGVEGWRIADGLLLRFNDQTVWEVSANSVRLEVNGYAHPRAAIDLVRIVSQPTYDSDNDGVRDTYVMGDKVLVDVEFKEPVVVPGTGPQLRLRVGADATVNRRSMDLESVLNGGMTLRFAYTVVAADSDPDGVFVETLASGRLFFGPGSATAVKSVKTGVSVNRNKHGLPSRGDPLAKVDGSKTSSDRGPVPKVHTAGDPCPTVTTVGDPCATVNGASLTVTYDRSLDTSVDNAALAYRFAVRGAGSVGAGNRNGYQHPSVVSVTGDSNEKLQLTLGDPARAGDTVRLSYELWTPDGLLKGAGDSGKVAPAFVDLAVTNNTTGTAGPAPLRASVKGTELSVVFDGALDENSVPATTDFSVRRGNNAVNPASVSIEGNAVVLTDLALVTNEGVNVYVSYTQGANPIQDVAGNAVATFPEERRVTASAKGALAVQAAQVTAAIMGVNYDKVLNPANVPGADRFTIHHPLDTGETDIDLRKYTDIVAVWVEGRDLLLELANPVYPCGPATPFTLTYTKPAGARPNLQGLDGVHTPAITKRNVSNGRSSWCVDGRVEVPSDGSPPGFQRSSPHGKSVTLNFNPPLDQNRKPRAKLFSLTGTSGSSAPTVTSVEYTDDGGVVLTLNRAVDPGEAVTVSYSRSQGEPGLWNTEGKQIADFSDVPVPVTPGITGVEVVSDTGEDDTYSLGETLRVRVTFSEAVDVDTSAGAPRLQIDMDPANWGAKWAAYESGSGTAELVFAYQVVKPNLSTQGIAVLADTLQANGGAIRSAASGEHAAMEHDGLGHDPAHKVDWQANSPAAGTATITGTARVGETLTADTSDISDNNGLAEATFSFQWMADDADISGAADDTYTLTSADEGKAVKVRVSFTDDAGNTESLTSAATTSVEAPPELLTASLENEPASHDGSGSFTFDLRFSEEVKLSYRTLRDHVFTVTEGTVAKAERLDKPSNMRWRITIKPDSHRRRYSGPADHYRLRCPRRHLHEARLVLRDLSEGGDSSLSCCRRDASDTAAPLFPRRREPSSSIRRPQLSRENLDLQFLRRGNAVGA